jgi:hypothetical protein
MHAYAYTCKCMYVYMFTSTHTHTHTHKHTHTHVQAGLLPTGEVVLSFGQSNWAKAQMLEKIAFSHGMHSQKDYCIHTYIRIHILQMLVKIAFSHGTHSQKSV